MICECQGKVNGQVCGWRLATLGGDMTPSEAEGKRFHLHRVLPDYILGIRDAAHVQMEILSEAKAVGKCERVLCGGCLKHSQNHKKCCGCGETFVALVEHFRAWEESA